MNQAKNNPVNKAQREFESADVKLNQRAAVDITKPRESESYAEIESVTADTNIDLLAFMEEPVTIRIQKSSEKYAPNVVDCWVNGKGAEQFINGKWMVCGWLPVNHIVTTRRKYLEVLARAKVDSLQTEVRKHEDREDNMAIPYTSSKYPFSVIEDRNPLGHEWLSRVLQGQ